MLHSSTSGETVSAGIVSHVGPTSGETAVEAAIGIAYASAVSWSVSSFSSVQKSITGLYFLVGDSRVLWNPSGVYPSSGWAMILSASSAALVSSNTRLIMALSS